MRARARADLEALRDEYSTSLGPITVGGGSDDPYRARIDANDLADAIGRIIEDIDYANFNIAVGARQAPERAHVYRDLEHATQADAEGGVVAGKKPAYGGIVVDANPTALSPSPYPFTNLANTKRTLRGQMSKATDSSVSAGAAAVVRVEVLAALLVRQRPRDVLPSDIEQVLDVERPDPYAVTRGRDASLVPSGLKATSSDRCTRCPAKPVAVRPV